MVTVEESITVQMRPAETFALLSEPVNEPRWMFGVVGVNARTTARIYAGMQQQCHFGVGGLRFKSMSAVIEEYEEGKRFVRKRVGGFMAMRGEFSVEPEGEGTRIIWRMNVGLKGGALTRWIEPVIGQWMRMSIAISLRKFKRVMAAAREVEMAAAA